MRDVVVGTLDRWRTSGRAVVRHLDLVADLSEPHDRLAAVDHWHRPAFGMRPGRPRSRRGLTPTARYRGRLGWRHVAITPRRRMGWSVVRQVAAGTVDARRRFSPSTPRPVISLWVLSSFLDVCRRWPVRVVVPAAVGVIGVWNVVGARRLFVGAGGLVIAVRLKMRRHEVLQYVPV